MTCIEKYNEQKTSQPRLLAILIRLRVLLLLEGKIPAMISMKLRFAATGFSVTTYLCIFMRHMGIMGIPVVIMLAAQRCRSIF